MELPSVLVAILGFFKFLWAYFFTKNKSPKPFRLLNLPSLAHDVIFPELSTEELYHLSKLSRRSRYVVKMFTRRQKYYFSITTAESFCRLEIFNWLDRKTFHRELIPIGIENLLDCHSYTTYHSGDFWTATKEEIAYFLDVFTRNVNCLSLEDIKNITKMTEFLKSATPLAAECVCYTGREIDNEMYKYVLREFKDVKKLSISASPSADFRFDDMEQFTGDEIRMKDADWLTVDNLTRCFINVEKVRLWTISGRYLNVLVFNRFLNEWRNGLIVGKLCLECQWPDFDLRPIFKNVPKTQVKRVEVENKKRVFKNGKCFLIRQEESGVEAIVYFGFNNTFINHSICFTTNFRLLRDDESVVDR